MQITAQLDNMSKNALSGDGRRMEGLYLKGGLQRFGLDLNPNAEAYELKTVWQATENGDSEEIKLSLKNGKDINRPNPVTLDTPLIIAARSRNNELASLLLSFGADVNIPNAAGDCPLHWAAYHGEREMVLDLLSKGAKIDAKGEYANTPLHVACSNGQLEVVSILLQEGASISSKNIFGNDAMMMSYTSEIIKMVKSIAEGHVSREAFKQSERERIEKCKQEEKAARQQLETFEAQKREQDERDNAKREAILVEERQIEEEELAQEYAEIEELRRQVKLLLGKVIGFVLRTNIPKNMSRGFHWLSLKSILQIPSIKVKI